MARHPATPDCGIKSCTRAAYRFGVCRHHSHLVPERAGFELQRDIWSATFRLKSQHYAKAIREANRKHRAARLT